jgi:hypothetical protein
MAPSFSLLADITGQSHGGDFAEGDELHADKVEFTQDTIFLQEKDRIVLVLRHCPRTLALFWSNDGNRTEGRFRYFGSRRCGHAEPLDGMDLFFKINVNGRLIARYVVRGLCGQSRSGVKASDLGARARGTCTLTATDKNNQGVHSKKICW